MKFFLFLVFVSGAGIHSAQFPSPFLELENCISSGKAAKANYTGQFFDFTCVPTEGPK